MNQLQTTAASSKITQGDNQNQAQIKKHPNSASALNKQPKIIGAYVTLKLLTNFFIQQIGEVLGRGACGKVFKGLNFQTGQLVAIKQIKINTFKEEKKQ